MSGFLRSTVGKKIIVALTGLVLFFFVVGHLVGNLLVFQGAEKYNAYAQAIKDMPPLLWGTRLVLLISVFFHFLFTVQLAGANRKSRPIAYTHQTTVQANLASRTMIWGGIFLSVFIVYHLLHFTVGMVHPQFDPHDVYSNLITGFSSPLVVVFYLLGMVALGFHLYHGVWSVFQTLGLNHPPYNQARRILAVGAAFLITFGYSIIPISVALGCLR